MTSRYKYKITLEDDGQVKLRVYVNNKIRLTEYFDTKPEAQEYVNNWIDKYFPNQHREWDEPSWYNAAASLKSATI